MVIIFISFFIIAVVFIALKNNFQNGKDIAIFLYLILPSNIYIEVSGSLPILSVHRLIILILLLFWIKNRDKSIKVFRMFIIRVLLLYIGEVLISVFLSSYFITSLKTYFSLLIEHFLLFMIVLTSTENENHIERLLKRVFAALSVVAFIGMIERYTGFNPKSLIPSGGRSLLNYEDFIGLYGRITSTYRHPILLGVVLSMGWPLALYMVNKDNRRAYRVMFWICGATMLASIYFTLSRGAWLASAIAGVFFFLLSTKKLKKRMLIILILIPTILIFKPGVYNTILNRSSSTFNTDSGGGDSYSYRWFLWRKAFFEVTKSTKTTLFGYGMGTHMLLDLEEEYILGSRIRTYDFLSWDNEYAVQLLETGFVGLFAFIFLYYSIFIKLIKIYRKSQNSQRDLLVVIISGVIVILFMMTNVKIFDVKIICLFWLYIALGLKIEQVNLENLKIIQRGL